MKKRKGIVKPDGTVSTIVLITQIGIGMMTRGEVALIVAQRGLKADIVDSRYFTAVILLIILSSILTPIILKAIYASDEKSGTPA